MGAGALAVDGEAVFWGTIDGLVRKHDASGNTTLASESDAITSVAVDATHVYYAIIGRIRRVPRGGGVAEDVFTNAGIPSNITLVGADVFWLDYGQGIAAGSVRRNGTPILSQLDTPGGMAIDGAYVYVDCALAIVAQNGIMGPLIRTGLDGSQLEIFAKGLNQPGSVRTFGDRIYWIEAVDETSSLHGGVESIKKDGSSWQNEVTTDGLYPVDFTVDDSGIYVTTLSQVESALLRGQTSIAQTGGVVYEAVRASPSAVYWSIAWTSASPPPADGATVRKICK
jgi:hypothetical protein